LEIYPKNNTDSGRYLSYVKNTGKILVIRIDKSAIKRCQYYEVAIHYKIKKNEIISEKFIKFPIPLISNFIKSPEVSLRYGLHMTLNVDSLIPEKIRRDKNASIVHLFIALPDNTIEFHADMPQMLVIPSKTFKHDYEKYFTKWIFVNYESSSIPFEIKISDTQPILYYVSGESPTLALLNYPHHDVYVEYTLTNYPVVWISFFATVFGFISTLIGLTLGIRKIIQYSKRKDWQNKN